MSRFKHQLPKTVESPLKQATMKLIQLMTSGHSLLPESPGWLIDARARHELGDIYIYYWMMGSFALTTWIHKQMNCRLLWFSPIRRGALGISEITNHLSPWHYNQFLQKIDPWRWTPSSVRRHSNGCQHNLSSSFNGFSNSVSRRHEASDLAR